MTPMVVAARSGWFDSYEWIIRANPDVTIADASALEGAMRTSTAAVLFTCHGRVHERGDGVHTISTQVRHDDRAQRPRRLLRRTTLGYG